MIFEQVDIDLDETYNDVKQFTKILDNIKFKEEHTTEFILEETSFDELKATMSKVRTIVGKNARSTPKLKTFISFFYAGHGATKNNQQVLVLNGDEKKILNRETREYETQWVYVYEIESWFKNNFTVY